MTTVKDNLQAKESSECTYATKNFKRDLLKKRFILLSSDEIQLKQSIIFKIDQN